VQQIEVPVEDVFEAAARDLISEVKRKKLNMDQILLYIVYLGECINMLLFLKKGISFESKIQDLIAGLGIIRDIHFQPIQVAVFGLDSIRRTDALEIRKIQHAKNPLSFQEVIRAGEEDLIRSVVIQVAKFIRSEVPGVGVPVDEFRNLALCRQ
jgi:hypothetical protein